MSLDLGQLLSGYVFGFLLIFTRISVIMMLFPGVGEAFVNTRAKLMFSLGFASVLLPVIGPSLPKLPDQVAQIFALLAIEVLIGLFFGTILRVLMSALEIGGTIASSQIGLSNASIYNPTMATQGTLPGALLGIAAIVLIFSTGTETLLLRSIAGTYEVFKPGEPLVMHDVYATIVKIVGRSFALGAEMAAPFLIIGILISIVFGVIARLMPQIQIFALSMPLHIGAGLALFGITLSGMLLYWLQEFVSVFRGMGI